MSSVKEAKMLKMLSAEYEWKLMKRCKCRCGRNTDADCLHDSSAGGVLLTVL